METNIVPLKSIKRKWYLIDATNLILGRSVSTLASLLTGKGKPEFSPNQDHGDYCIVINAEKIRVTGKKAEMKTYFHHTKHPGGGRVRTYKKQMQLDCTKILTHAIGGMLPKSKLGRAMAKKLFIYKGDKHPHAAQKPTPLAL
ncbi:MAG: 50S ribosomal protein L13 [Chitinivibrionales bacterium]|nr:50S ribosomal protein L13 [Chitinivibrionales bacterium]